MKDVVGGFAALRAELVGAAQQHSSAVHVADERAALIRWLLAVIAFAQAMDRLTRSALVLVDALTQLNHGAASPIFKPKVKSEGGRAPTGALKRSLQGYAVGVVGVLVQCGDRLPEARRKVAKVLDDAGVRPARGSRRITERTVKEWMDVASADPRSITARFLAHFPPAGSHEQPKSLQAQLLNGLARTVRFLREKSANPPS